MARGGGDGGAAAFEAGDAFFQDRHGRVGQPRIDVAEIVQVEERGGVIDVVEHIRGRLVDRRRAGAGDWVGRGAGMHGAGLEAIAVIVRRGRPLANRAGPRRLRRAVLDDAAVDTAHDNSPPSRPNSIFGQRFMMISMPAASPSAAASSLRMPSCIHTTGAPIAIASLTMPGASLDGRNTSTMSMESGMSRSEA